jgi:hypothetical protein
MTNSTLQSYIHQQFTTKILADGLKFKEEEISRIKKILGTNKSKMIKSPTDLQPTKQQEKLFILDTIILHDVA